MSNPKGNGSGQNKYQAAVDGARQKADAKAEASGGEVEIQTPAAKAMLSRPTDEQIAQMMNDETMEFAPQVHSMDEGEMVEGILEGNGPSTTFTQKDQVTGQEITRVVDTWILASESGSLRISILSSVQLDKKLPPYVGGRVRIFRGKDVKTSKGFRVTDYLVSGPRREDGRPRSWVTNKTIDAIASNTIDGQDSRALPAPSAPSAPATGGEDAHP